MVSTGDDPRLEDDASAQIFNTDMVLVSGAYANEVPTELAYDIFDTFPYPILMFLLISPNSQQSDLPLLDRYALMDGTYNLKEQIV